MEKKPCGDKELLGSFDSSGGVFPNGYCLWEGDVPIGIHCAPGYDCGGAPPVEARARFEGDVVKVGCTKDPE